MVYVKSNNIYYLIYVPKVPLYDTAGVRARSAAAVHRPLSDLRGGAKPLVPGAKGMPWGVLLFLMVHQGTVFKWTVQCSVQNTLGEQANN